MNTTHSGADTELSTPPGRPRPGLVARPGQPGGGPVPPTTQAWDWQLNARCRTEDPTLFFHIDGERGAPRRQRQRAAEAICAPCLVRTTCRNHALRFPELFGTWGGLSEDDRNQLTGRARRHLGPLHGPAPSAH